MTLFQGDSDHDNKLFSLITLLCSTLIYNMTGVFNQEALDKLKYPFINEAVSMFV